MNEVYLGRDLSYYTYSYYEADAPFKNQEQLSAVIIGNKVSKIGKSAFYGCSSLVSIVIPKNVTWIGERAFYECTSLTKVFISDGSDSLTMGSTFVGCPIEEVYLGRDLLYYNSYDAPFKNQEQLTTVIIGNKVSTIGKSAFYRCSSVTSIVVPNSVTRIGDSAFDDCSALNSVYISDIGAWCNITFENSDANPLGNAHALLFINDELATEVIIPNSVNSINDYAFYNCNSLTSIELPNSITSIGRRAFEGCSSLTSIEVPSNVASIGWNAFTGCSALESLLLGSGLTSVGNNAFKGCTALKVIKSLNPTPPAIKSSTFDGVDKEACQLIVTKGNLAYYWLDPYWKEFLNISDDLLALNPLPIVRYGDGSVNLADYAPEGVSLTYESSNSDVAKIEGSMLTICGAGEATVSASIAEEGTPMEIIGQMRTFIVNKADLTVTAESYEIEQGDPMPDFAIKYDGFAYDDNADSLEELPMIICEATDTSKAGEYEISLKGGTDSNYNMNLINGRLIIKDSSAVDNVESDNAPFSCVVVDREIHISGLADSQIVYVYDTSGLLCYYGDSRNGEVLTYRPNKSGMYIVKSGRHNVKVLVM